MPPRPITRSRASNPVSKAAIDAAIIVRGKACWGTPSPTALPTRTPAADPSPSATEKVTLWIENTIWKAWAAASPSRVESAIRIEKPASSSPEAIAGTMPNAASRAAPAGTLRHAASDRSRTPRALARGSVQAAAIIPAAPIAEAIAVAAAAPTAPSAGSPR